MTWCSSKNWWNLWARASSVLHPTFPVVSPQLSSDIVLLHTFFRDLWFYHKCGDGTKTKARPTKQTHKNPLSFPSVGVHKASFMAFSKPRKRWIFSMATMILNFMTVTRATHSAIILVLGSSDCFSGRRGQRSGSSHSVLLQARGNTRRTPRWETEWVR